MPIHRILKAHLHEDLLDVERAQGERVVRTVDDGEYVIVYTEYADETLRFGAVDR